jgi:exodeoxyribonuclease VII large subunit
MSEHIYSVNELTRLAETILKSVGKVAVEAEISSFKRHYSGHWYFDIKDNSGSVLKCCMFSGANRWVIQQPKVGDQIRILAAFNIYKGTMNLVVSKLSAAGLGNKEQELKALRKKLEAEGLFDPQRHRPLPRLPTRIGVVTSSSSAALRDILKVLRSRLAGCTIYIAHCATEGEDSAPDILRSLRLLNEHGKSEVIIVGRGGGAKDSLSAFNVEVLIRGIAASSIPTVCAVGHESDSTLCDFVADQRAATPSHAAELVSSLTRHQMLEHVLRSKEILENRILREIQSHREVLRQIQPRDPLSRIMENQLRMEALHVRLEGAMNRLIEQDNQRLKQIIGQLNFLSPAVKLKEKELELESIRHRLQMCIELRLERERQNLAQYYSQLSALNPRDVMKRGYSVTVHNGRSVQAASVLKKGDEVLLRFEEGTAVAKIIEVVDRSLPQK